jgi:formylmethanofuran dehydrogenase subunit E
MSHDYDSWLADDNYHPYRCDKCGASGEEGEGHEIGDNWVCDECFENDFIECERCREPYEENDSEPYEGDNPQWKGHWLCPSCVGTLEEEDQIKKEDNQNEMVRIMDGL